MRLRQRVRDEGLDSLAPHELIEYLLCHIVPRQDVNALAHRLIDRFGGVEEVLCAQQRELESVEGVGNSVAQWLMLLGEAVDACRALQPEDGVPLTCFRDLLRYIGGLSRRQAPASLQLCLDMESCLVFSRELCPSRAWGETEVLRGALQDVLLTGARSVILLVLAGNAQAEPDDYDLARVAAYADTLHLAGCTLLDVVFLGNDSIYSMRGRNRMPEFDADDVGRAIREDYMRDMPDSDGQLNYIFQNEGEET